MAFDAGLPPTGWGAAPSASTRWGAAPTPTSTAAPAPAPAPAPWLDEVLLGAGPGASDLLGADGTGGLYSPASVLSGAALAATPPDERDALGEAGEQAQVDDALLGQPAAGQLSGLSLGLVPTTTTAAAGGVPGGGAAGLLGELSSSDRGDLLSLQEQWVSAGDGSAQFSQWLGAFAQVAGRGSTGVSGALGLDVVV